MYQAAWRSLAVITATAASVVHTSALKTVMTSGQSLPSTKLGSTGAAANAVGLSKDTTAPVDGDVGTVNGASSIDGAKAIIDGFEPRAYRAPWWAKNAHFSTIFGSGEIQKKLGSNGPQITYRRERWDTPDGDFVDVDFLDAPGGEGAVGSANFASNSEDDSAPFAVLTHGLESTSTAPLTARMALAYQRQGFRVAVMCFRSCSGEDNRTLRAYHLGFTEDLELVCKTLRERHPNSPLFLSGFSLGGNVIAKFLGELGERARDLGIMGGAVTCVPFDAVSCQKRIDTGFGKAVYAKNFLNSLVPKMMRKSLTDPRVAEVIDLERLQKVTTIGEFDDMVIAPVFGFDDFQDYYRKSQSGQFLKGVRVPLLAVQARNDPFMDPDRLPTLEDLQGAPVRLSYHEHGGHCAFVSNDKQENQKGWLATELARFGQHVHCLSDSPPTAADN